jgi:hypothetical protein
MRRRGCAICSSKSEATTPSDPPAASWVWVGSVSASTSPLRMSPRDGILRVTLPRHPRSNHAPRIVGRSRSTISCAESGVGRAGARRYSARTHAPPNHTRCGRPIGRQHAACRPRCTRPGGCGGGSARSRPRCGNGPLGSSACAARSSSGPRKRACSRRPSGRAPLARYRLRCSSARRTGEHRTTATWAQATTQGATMTSRRDRTAANDGGASLVGRGVHRGVLFV